MKKLCFKCKTKKKLIKFTKNKATKNGVETYCLSCNRKYYKLYYQQRPEQRKRRKKYRDKYRGKNKQYFENWKLKDRYGITTKQKNKLIKKQKNKCSICESKFKNTKNLHVDHNHKTNKVRSLLCVKCNLLLGTVNDKIKILKSAIKYLRKYKK